MFFSKYLSLISIAFLLTMTITSQALAHMMVAQHGTLNIVDDGVFMVLSVPVSAFSEADSDKDGKLSSAELSQHRSSISKAINEHIVLSDSNGVCMLEGLIISLASHGSPKQPALQLIVMGRFKLATAEINNLDQLAFKMNVFGKTLPEKSIEMTVTRNVDQQKRVFKLTQDEPSQMLLIHSSD